MKCKYCGANLQLTDAVCPYCGKPNPRAERYTKDKQYYEQDYAETSQKVKRVWKLSYDWMTRGITLVVLGVLVFGLLFVTFLADDHSYYKKQDAAVANFTSVSEQMDQYLAAGKYEQYFAYCKSYNLTGWTAGPFLPWQPQTKCIEIERFIKEHLNGYLAADSIYEQNDHLETIGGLLPEFYDTDSLCAVAKDVIDCEKTETDLRNIQKDLELSLKICFGLTDEELAELPTMTDEEVLLLLEEKHEW